MLQKKYFLIISGIVEADELLMKYSEKGRKYRSRKEYEKAKNAWTKTLQLKPGYVQAQQGLLAIPK